MAERVPVAVLGATGSVGQRFIQLLDKHPMFEVVALTGSERKGGLTYQEACHWILTEPMPAWARDMKLLPSEPEHTHAKVAFSALPADAAREVEPMFAQAGVVVCSNASTYRTASDVPLLLPEVNPGHAALVSTQRQARGWSGALTTNPNCTATGMTVTLKALHDAFGLRRIFAVSLQAVSGAGYPGVASLDIIDNVIPYIGGSEEDKVEWEPRKMLGKLVGNEVVLADFTISAHTNRVPVSDGHLVCLSIELANPAPLEQVTQALRDFQAPSISRSLPSAPHPVIDIRPENDRPQPRLDRMRGGGMTTVVGRLRPDPLFHYKLVVLSHNTIRGAAGGSLYNAELLLDSGYIK